jgi:serine/threonine-protein kinase PpkA
MNTARPMPVLPVLVLPVLALPGLIMLVLLSLLRAALAQGVGPTPLPVAEAPELFQRVLTLPGARLAPEAGAPPGATVLPTFSILYVYARNKIGGQDWLAVGARTHGPPDGWLPAGVTQDWHTMLVMQYAPRGQRDRVAFFNNAADLDALLAADDSAKRGQQIAAGLASGRPDPAIVAAEPAGAVDTKAQFYVMPVLSARVRRLADGTPVRVVEVASAVAQNTRPAVPAPPKPQPPPPQPQPSPPAFRVGLVFLLDTTKSMGPYIEAVADLVRKTINRLDQSGTADRVSIGLVGYRSNIARDPRLEYVTRIFAPLSPNTPLQQTLLKLDAMSETPYSTPAWDEDAFAGLHTALTEMNWQPFALRLLVLVTDSGALPGNSPLVQFRNFDIENVVDLANSLKVAVFPFHLITPAGDRFGNRSIAIRQWQRLGQTGDANVSKYLRIPADSPARFSSTLDSLVDQLTAVVVQNIAANKPVERPAIPPVSKTPVEPEQQVAAALVNELFRAQAEYLGARNGAAAPPFFRAYASDHDLANPRLRSLGVQVFLTRTQLSELGQSLQLIVDQAKQAALAPQDFFDNLQVLSAQTAADPNRPAGTGAVDSLGASNLLPSFLKLLPYHSKVLDMTRSYWLSGGVTGQQEFIDELDYKIQEYHDIYVDLNRWTQLGASGQSGTVRSDSGDAVCPVPLDVLP